jgi:polyphosphate kinase 2 (PPK2 family)
VGGEIVLFNRSWYNRAGVESVMGFCTAAEHESFMDDAPRFEQLLVRSGILLRKYYLDIGKAEQKRRLADRASNPLKHWKLSPIDDVAVKNWEKYSEARNEMLARTHTAFAPWEVVRTDDKRTARLNVIKSILASLDYKGKDERLLRVNPEVVFSYGAEHVRGRRIAP